MPITAGAEEVYSERTLEIARKLQCPVCSGQSVADSNSELARQMRDTIEERVQAGQSEDEIVAFFVARYGDSILTDPPKSGFSLNLWLAPIAVLVMGALVVGLYLRERTAGGVVTTATYLEDEELDRLASEVLGDDGRIDRHPVVRP